MAKLKYENIPTNFVLSNWEKCVNECDNETPMFCYCGRLASGFHTSRCSKFLKKVKSKIYQLYLKEGV